MHWHSMFIAVLFGGAIAKVVPERYIRIGTGVLFLASGLLILRALLETLAAEEDAHFRTIAEVRAAHANIGLAAGAVAALPAGPALTHDVADAADRPLVEHAVEHERATAQFYEDLARLTPVSALRSAFRALAAAEREHMARLESFREPA